MNRVLIVDDHPVFRRGLRALLAASGFEDVSEAASGAEAVAAAQAELPDIVVMDLGLPDMSGLEATARIIAERPGTRVVVVTMFQDAASVGAALDSGAIGYVAKDSDPEQIIAAVRAAAMGASLLGSGLHRPTAPVEAPSSLLESTPFTRSERRVAQLLMQGLSNAVIAARMGVAPKTVANYVSAVLLKLGATNRREAAVMLRGG